MFKRIGLIILCVVFLFAGQALAIDRSVDSSVQTPFTAEEVAAGDSATSSAYALGSSRGYCSIQLTITGSGTLKLEYLVSNDGSTFGTVDNSDIDDDIATGLTAGTYEYVVELPPFAWFKIKATETGTSDQAVISQSYLFVQ